MLSEVMEHFNLQKELRNAGYFETSHHKYLHKEIRAAIPLGKLIALTGIVGCGKTTTLRKIRENLIEGKEVRVSRTLSLAKSRVSLGTLILVRTIQGHHLC